MVSGSRSKSTWSTGAAGLLMLAAAFVMMVCAAPRTHAWHEPASSHVLTHDRLASWVAAYQVTRTDGRTPVP